MNFDELRTKKRELDKQINLLRIKMKEKAADHFVKSLKPVFDKYPSLLGYSWTQYTPYWNDGDTCYFGSNYQEGEPIIEGIENLNDLSYEECNEMYKAHNLDKIDEEIYEVLPSCSDDEMLSFFGDHCRVTITRDGIEVEEYDHS